MIPRRGTGLGSNCFRTAEIIGAPLDKATQQHGQLSSDLFGQQRLVQVAQAFAVGRPGVFEQAGDAPLTPVFGFTLAEVLQEFPAVRIR